MPRVKLFDEEEVLEKAMKLFWKQGFYATSMQDLVNELGINRASIYDTYGDKKKLFLKAFSLYRKTSRTMLKTFLYSHSSVKKGFLELFLLAVDDGIEDKERKGCFVVNSTTELASEDEIIFEIIKENKQVFEELFYDHLKLGVTRGEIDENKDIRAIASFLFIFNNGLKVMLKAGSSREELKSTVNLALSILD
ncbi:TetR/AcrR family transcriptional regulator [Aquimarina sp. 2304DJ70-9]|uniref:TetR/AcrR family transcriptional regulator n=1 Tax=Aquimarina penaris TaxID=3231044 RepID=UPI00346381D9